MENKKGSKKLASWRYSDKIKFTQQGKKKEYIQHQIKKKLSHSLLLLLLLSLLLSLLFK